MIIELSFFPRINRSWVGTFMGRSEPQVHPVRRRAQNWMTATKRNRERPAQTVCSAPQTRMNPANDRQPAAMMMHQTFFHQNNISAPHPRMALVLRGCCLRTLFSCGRAQLLQAA
jgi:hypothetical protein